MNKINQSDADKLLLIYSGLIKQGEFINESFENLGNAIGDLLFSIELLEHRDSTYYIKIEKLLDSYSEKADLILHSCKEDLINKLLDLLSGLKIGIDGINNQKTGAIISFPEKVKVLPENIQSNKTTLKALENKSEQHIVLETIAKVISIIKEENLYLIQPLFEKFEFPMVLKDNFNNIVCINTLGALAMHGTIQDFQNRNCYELFPKFTKKYHDDDLRAIRQNTPIKNILEKVYVGKTNPIVISLIVDKIPIRTMDNKPLILAAFKKIDK